MVDPRGYVDSTLKELFALSGNQCAFPACRRPLIDDFGNVVGQIAHIHGVRPGSARYVTELDGAKLREPANLVVLCYDHHIATNDETLYSAGKMREMKDAHERRFGGVIAGLRAKVEDQTAHAVTRPPVNLGRYRAALGLTAVETKEAVAAVRRAMSALAELPPDARSVLATVVGRGTVDGEHMELPTGELRRVLDVSDQDLAEINNILIRNGYITVDTGAAREGYFRHDAWVVTKTHAPNAPDMPFLLNVRWISDELGVPVRSLLVDLDWREVDDV